MTNGRENDKGRTEEVQRKKIFVGLKQHIKQKRGIEIEPESRGSWQTEL